MRFSIFVSLILSFSGALLAQDHSGHGPAKTAILMSGLGALHHPVSTRNRLIYAFNHDEAAHSFKRAAELDSNLAMAYWGIAEAVGPNYNDSASDDRFRQAHEAIQKAIDLSNSVSPSEKAYIQGMALRFPQILSLTAGMQRKPTTMPCANWSRSIQTIWMQLHSSLNQI